MGEAIRGEFLHLVNESSKYEAERAKRLMDITEDVGIAHLLCGFGSKARVALEEVLLLSSPLTFETFLANCFLNTPCTSQDNASKIKEMANIEKKHPSKILLRDLCKMVPDMKVKDLIKSLECASLYRAIARLEKEDLEALAQHARSDSDCLNPVPLPMPNVLSSQVTRRTNFSKTYRNIILLSFARDGQDIANQLENELKEPFGKSKKSYFVIKLSDHTGYLAEDRVRNLKDIISKVDYIVPVLTNGYFDILERRVPPDNATIDEEFASLLISLVADEWASNGFKNYKVRCYKPRDVNPQITVFPPFTTTISDRVALREVWLKPKK